MFVSITRRLLSILSMPNDPTSLWKISPQLEHVEVCNIPWLRGCIFTDLEKDEKLLHVVRKHWITLLHTTIYIVILGIISSGVFMLGRLWSIPTDILLLSIIGFIMIWLQYIFVHWCNDELDILLITNERLLMYEQVNFLDRKLYQAGLSQIQEVNASTSGILGNILNYGDMIIMTAGEASNFHLYRVREALETSRIIHNYISEYGKKTLPIKPWAH